MGTIFRPLTLRVYSPKTNPYPLVALYRGGREKPSVRPVHRLVLEAFVGPCPKGMLCRHGDDNPLNNNVSNLSWGTPKENQRDRRRNGTTCEGMKSVGAKLTDDQVREIRRIYKNGGITHKTLAGMFGMSKGQITSIISRRCWAHIKEGE